MSTNGSAASSPKKANDPTRSSVSEPKKKFKVLTSLLTILSLGISLASAGALLLNHYANGSLIRGEALTSQKSLGGDVNILLLGLDSRRANDGSDLPRKLLDIMHVGSSSEIGGYNTNTMILIHIPKDGKSAVAVSIPRDDYVNVPGLGFQKIKEAYGLAKYYGEIPLIKKGMQNPTLELTGRSIGRASTIKTIENLLGVPIDHYAEVNLVSFYDLANAIGGVQVCLKHAVNDSQYSGAVFPAGVQTITGVQALEFVRQRHGLPNGDLDRTHRQQAFITGVINKFRKAGIFNDLSSVGNLLAVAKKDVIVDPGWNVIDFIPRVKALTGGNIKFYTAPILRYAMINGQSVNVIDPNQVHDFVQNLFYPKPGMVFDASGAVESPTVTAATATVKSGKVAESKGKKKKKVATATKATNVYYGPNGSGVSVSGIPCVN
jgi:LCP family protein required for cell wall assembly